MKIQYYAFLNSAIPFFHDEAVCIHVFWRDDDTREQRIMFQLSELWKFRRYMLVVQ